MANVYFLIITFLSFFPSISPFTPLSAVAPFVFVIAVSMIREGFEDYSRYKSDKEVNSQKVQLCSSLTGRIESTTAQKLQVGNLVQIVEGERLAADVILLESSGEGQQAFIQTSSLDGEKNLKKRMTSKGFKMEQNAVFGFEGLCDCDTPNEELYKFSGSFQHKGKVYVITEN